MIVQARIYEPHASAIHKLATEARRKVSTEVQIAVEEHLRKPRKKKGSK